MSYYVNEIFYSLQGEGFHAGRAACFVRFAGCNLRCDVEPGPLSPGGFACDTEFQSSVTYDEATLVEEITRQCPSSALVVFSGGEPLRQLTATLVKATGRMCCVETNGSLPLSEELQTCNGLLWITCSPKVAEHAIKLQHCHELKYVRGRGQGIPQPQLTAPYRYLSPAFSGMYPEPGAVETCIELVKANPDWRLALQFHKIWAIR